MGGAGTRPGIIGYFASVESWGIEYKGEACTSRATPPCSNLIYERPENALRLLSSPLRPAGVEVHADSGT
jgi:hypothetical protein